MSLGEFELIETYFRQESGGMGVAMGIGDDCALLEIPVGQQLAVSMDTLVGDVHFPKNADPELIAERALRVNLSDLAAMGAEPLWFTLGLTLLKADAQWVKAFSQGLFRVAREYGVALVGGDTTRGNLSMTIQVHGAVSPGAALLRGSASPGDQIYVTGALGDGAAALAVIKQELGVGKSAFNYFMDRYYRPQPQVEAGQRLVGLANSAIDISDGLIADLGHICEQSVVGASIHLEQIPLSEPVAKLVSFEQGLEWALSGGDDYQLCFTVSPENVDELEGLVESGKLEAYPIGEITRDQGVACWYKGERVVPSGQGFQHFNPDEQSSGA
ncbi:thiamine-phosphate kinase [Pseudomaricurvus sp.]|uniref:thiamine-phosphate kinase n=1 Tax=Pseudomaricurvus sp. TaxID=2004510 RepID=UPI003F6ABB68